MKSVKFSIWSFVAIVMMTLFVASSSFATLTVPMELKNQYKAMFVGSMVTANVTATAGLNIKQAVTPLNIPFETSGMCDAWVASLTSETPPALIAKFFGGNSAASQQNSWATAGYVGFIGKCVVIGD